MSKHTYKQATKYFQIPVPGWDDGIWPDVEIVKWQTIENMLLAAMRGNINAVFREGDMRLREYEDGKYCVSLTATGNEPALQGSVGGAFFNVDSSITWEGLEVGRVYYLYVKGSNKTFLDEKDVVPIVSSYRMVSPHVTLVAKADLMGDTLTIDKNPPGKLNARDIGQHVLDYDNPHGDKVIQDELLIKKRLAIGDSEDADLEFEVNGNIFPFKLSQLVGKLVETKTVVDFVSGGKEGVILNANGRVEFANVVRRNPEGGELGEISIGFNSDYPESVLPNQIKVWNSGVSGIPMRAVMECK